MKYKRIGHQKTYKPFEFVYEKIELTEDFPIDKPDEECIKELSSRIEAMARIIYPHLYEEMPLYRKMEELSPELKTVHWETGGKSIYSIPKNQIPDTNHSEPEEQKPLLQLIQESKTVGELKAYHLLVKVEKDKEKREELSLAYDAVLEALQNQTA